MSEEKTKKQQEDSGRDVSEKKESCDEKVSRLETELKEMSEKYLRALAESQNLIKRQTAEKEEFVRFANEGIILEFIDVYDHLKMSLSHVDEKAKGGQWAKGIECIVKKFKELLENNGVEEIKTAGEKFDHDTMEAMEGEGERVVKEIMAGYKLKGKVIRAARVALNDE